MQVRIDDIEMAIEFVSSSMSDSEAYIDVHTGEIHYVGDLVDGVFQGSCRLSC